MSDLITVQGIVLSAQPVGEYDKRIVLLTRERGKISAFAKGARRQNSPFMAAVNPFVFGNFTLYEGRSSYNLNQVTVTHHVNCGEEIAGKENLFFSQEAHGILDGDCLKKASPGEARTARRISPAALYTMQYIVSSPMTKLYSFTVTDEVLWELERHIQPYVAGNTDKKFKSLQILEVMM